MLRNGVLVVWYGGLLLQVAVTVVILYRRAYRQFPIFFAYTIFLAPKTAILLLLRRTGVDAYFYGYWIGEVLSWALCLAAIQEVMQRLFAPYQAVRRLATVLFRWGAGLLVAVAVLVALASPGNDTDRVYAGILVLERSVRVVQVGLLSLLFVLAGFLRLRWPQRAFGIALGFALFTSVELAGIAVRAHVGSVWHQFFMVFKPISFLVAQAVWMVYLALPERAPASEAPLAATMEGWDLALAELLHR